MTSQIIYKAPQQTPQQIDKSKQVRFKKSGNLKVENLQRRYLQAIYQLGKITVNAIRNTQRCSNSFQEMSHIFNQFNLIDY
ncbi:unnamed protein product [Paramecium primaurelia]|uniref:Uncharacterized protein n=1 Tax=Paramecium primaurelia TaxID=5886 RepID=A0A8S1QQH6_PARPR|nr:unnamed protein product [Paramecium primaurelia]